MPRVTRVAKCQVDQGRCGRCGDDLPKGSPYRWWKFRHGGKNRRCMKDSCNPSRSDLTQSPNLGTLYSLVDDVDIALESAEAIAETVRDLGQSVRDEVADVYRESAEAIREHFQESPTADECEEKADELDSYCDELEGAADEIDQAKDEKVNEGPVDCEHCDGNGYIEDTTTCDDCEGDGELTYMGEVDPRQCDGCDGSGEVEEQDDCPECGGSGHQEVEDDVDSNDELVEQAREIAQAAIDNCPL